MLHPFVQLIYILEHTLYRFDYGLSSKAYLMESYSIRLLYMIYDLINQFLLATKILKHTWLLFSFVTLTAVIRSSYDIQ